MNARDGDFAHDQLSVLLMYRRRNCGSEKVVSVTLAFNSIEAWVSGTFSGVVWREHRFERTAKGWAEARYQRVIGRIL